MTLFLKKIEVRMNAFLLLVSTFVRYQEINIEGNWYYESSESSYNEVYVNDVILTFNISSSRINIQYNYEVEGDSIYLFRNDSMRFAYRISKLENQIILEGYNKQYVLSPITTDFDFYRIRNTMLATDEFYKGFIKRMKKFSLNKD